MKPSPTRLLVTGLNLSIVGILWEIPPLPEAALSRSKHKCGTGRAALRFSREGASPADVRVLPEPPLSRLKTVAPTFMFAARQRRDDSHCIRSHTALIKRLSERQHGAQRLAIAGIVVGQFRPGVFRQVDQDGIGTGRATAVQVEAVVADHGHV